MNDPYVKTFYVKHTYKKKPLKYTMSELRAIEAAQAAGVSNRQIGRDYGMNPQTVSNLLRRWKAGKNPPKPEPEPAEEPREEPAEEPAEEPKKAEDPELEAYIADLLGPSGL